MMKLSSRAEAQNLPLQKIDCHTLSVWQRTWKGRLFPVISAAYQQQ